MDLKARDRVVDFLKKNVIGRTVSTTNPYAEDEDFSQSWTYQTLAVTENGFTYDNVVQIKQVRYALDSAGKRTGKGERRDRMYLLRTSIGQRLGTEILMGVAIPVISTFRDIAGTAFTVESFKLDNDKLSLEFTDTLPVSWPKPPGETGYDLISAKHTETLWVDSDGKLNRLFTQDASILDPSTRAVIKKVDPWKSEQKEQ